MPIRLSQYCATLAGAHVFKSWETRYNQMTSGAVQAHSNNMTCRLLLASFGPQPGAKSATKRQGIAATHTSVILVCGCDALWRVRALVLQISAPHHTVYAYSALLCMTILPPTK